MGIDTYSPAQLAAYLAGQKLQRLAGLQVSGFAQFDGGVGVVGGARLDRLVVDRDFLLGPDQLLEPGDVWKEISLPNPPNSVGLSNIGVSIASIPQRYRTLVIDYEWVFAVGAGVSFAFANFNGDNGAGHYQWQRLQWTNATVSATDSSTAFQNALAFGFCVEANQVFSGASGRLVIPNYSQVDHAGHTFHSTGSWQVTGVAGNYGGYAFGGNWQSVTVQGINLVEFGISPGGFAPISGKVTVRLLKGLNQ